MKDIWRLLQREKVKRSEIPLPTNRVLLLDKDETILDRKYKVTDSRIGNAVGDIQARGWTVGISSDAALEILQPLAQQSGINGPIIAERGAIIQTADGRIIMNSQDIRKIAESRQAMEAHLAEIGVPVIYNTDTRLKDTSLSWGSTGDIVVVVNALRKCSIALNIKRVQKDGSFGFDEEATSAIVQEMKPFYPDFSNLFEDINHNYGILILSNADVNKRVGTQVYMKGEGFQQIGMVGNSESDYVGDDIALHYAVGNATEGFKRRTDYVAQASLTQGVIEILEKLKHGDAKTMKRRRS